MILKPASATPLTACMLAEVLLEAGVPTGFLSVLPGGAQVAEWLIADQRVRFFAFTGSTEVGRSIQQAAGLRRTQMELGSIACTILCDDAKLDTRAAQGRQRRLPQGRPGLHLDPAAARAPLDRGRSANAGWRSWSPSLPYGDPRDPKTVVGPLISEKEAIRVEQWIAEAVAKGAKCLAGGGARQGAVIPPALLAAIDDSMKVGCQEVFGPVVCIVPFDTLDEAIARVNATPYGLATGIFTNRLDDAFARGAQARGRRRARQRDVELARGPDALRRLEGQRLRARGAALCCARDDRRTHRHLHPGLAGETTWQR